MYDYQPRKRNRWRKVTIGVVIVLALLVGLDFGAKAFAENEAATQIQKQGFPTKPNVSIAGFPFLTQVVTRHFHQITVTAGSFAEGPVTISHLVFVADNVHLSSNFQSGNAGPLNGTLTIGLGSISSFLSQAGPLASFLGGSGSLNIKAVNGNELQGSLNLAGGIVSWSATWMVVQAGPRKIDLKLVHSNGVPSGLLTSARNISVPLSMLPAGLVLQGGLNASASGIVAHVHADSLSF